eukprot:GILI01015699.1.p1 GENE.GILI01015699.1~~GILI01015699.1.p1  ORF type:complete len:290 (+),score=89.20 GILI01015699.1:779-1648(+)
MMRAWDDVSKISQEVMNKPKPIGLQEASLQTPITFKQAWIHFKTLPLTEQKALITAEADNTVECYCACGSISMNRLRHSFLEAERDQIFAIAKLDFDDSDSVHHRVLQTIFKRLTGNQVDCPRYGKHWELIGFQGEDPVTDLRGLGMLGPLLMLAFLNEHEDMCKQIHRISRDEIQNFPFAATAINMAKVTIEALREGRLHQLCNRRSEVMTSVVSFFMGTYYDWYRRWKEGWKTIADAGYVLNEVSRYCKRNVIRCIADMEEACRRRPGIDPSKLEFTDLSQNTVKRS